MTRTRTTRYVTLFSFILALALTAALAACASDEPSGGTVPDRNASIPTEMPASAETDREALVALYNATDGENWNRSDNWLSDAPLGEWYGVDTNNDGRVTVLILDNNELSGEIPPELGSLANLTELELSDNGLSGEIPPELGSLANLSWLGLSGNGLSGEIPPELGSLANLTYLWLYGNNLSGEIPAELGSLANLTELRLSGNPLSGCVPGSLEDQLTSSDLGDLPFC